MEPIVRYDDIVSSMRVLGIEKGDVLLMHSALSSLGNVEGGPKTVIKAFCDLVGEEGTLVMSTLTGWTEPFDAATTPSAVGIISEEFRKMPGVKRSLHPVHSVAAWGKHSGAITKGHDRCETGCGTGTPYVKIREYDGKIILLGVDMDRNTVMHTLEEAIDAKYLRTLDIPAPTYRDQEKIFTLKKFPPGHRDYLNLTPYLRRTGTLVQGYVGNALVKVIGMNDLFDVGLKLLEADPLFFICRNEDCNSCHWSRMLYGTDSIDMGRYEGTGCVDPTCEICVI